MAKKQVIQNGLLHRSEAKNLQDEHIVGLDEVGRGCLAGPVVAAAVVFPKDFDLIGLTDSKALSQKERFELELEIKNYCLSYGLGLVWMEKIREINILNASLLAMARALKALVFRTPKINPSILYVDGTFTIPPEFLLPYNLTPKTQKAIVSGDALEPSISAASILAKNFRDNLMIKLDARYPGYDFASHKGYGTKKHREAIEKLGICPLHRTGFRLVKQEQGRLC